MKLFFGVFIDQFQAAVSIENEFKESIQLLGSVCHDLVPYHGIELDEGEEQRLYEWIKKTQNKV